MINYHVPLAYCPALFLAIHFLYGDQSDQPGYFYELFMLSCIQSVLSIYIFHVSFYSATNKCWDLMGFWIHCLVFFALNIGIPICAVIMAFEPVADMQDLTPFTQLSTVFAVNSFVTALVYLIAKRELYSTYEWYRRRHVNSRIGPESSD